MKNILFSVIFFTCSLGLSQVNDSCLFEPFKGTKNIFIGTTASEILEKYPGCRVEKIRFSSTDMSSAHIDKIIYLDQLGITVHAEKQKWKNTYVVYDILMRDSCKLKTKDGIGIGSTYNDISKVYPSVLTTHESRIVQIHSSNTNNTQFTMRNNSLSITFSANGRLKADQFVTEKIEIHHSNLWIVS